MAFMDQVDRESKNKYVPEKKRKWKSDGPEIQESSRYTAMKVIQQVRILLSLFSCGNRSCRRSGLKAYITV
jgi:hypothetical protein